MDLTYGAQVTLTAPPPASIDPRLIATASIVQYGVPANNIVVTLHPAIATYINASTAVIPLTGTFNSPSWSIEASIAPVTFAFTMYPANAQFAYPAVTTNVVGTITSALLPDNSNAASSSTQTSSSSGSYATANRPTTTTTQSPDTKQSSFSSGDLAGAAIGCFFGGLLIAGLMAIFVFRRKYRQKELQVNYSKNSEMLLEPENTGGVVLYPDKMRAMQAHLPQPDDDTAIRSLVSRTMDEIEIFVEEFYVDVPKAMIAQVQDDQLSNSLYAFEDVSSTHMDNVSPTNYIKHRIAADFLITIDPLDEKHASLLPPEYQISRLRNGAEIDGTTARDQALLQLRTLTAYLRQEPNQDVSFLTQRDETIAKMVAEIETSYKPWARGSRDDRRKALSGMLMHISELGIKLFSQPCTYSWEWETLTETGKNKGNCSVLLPGLNKTTNHLGERLHPPLVLLKPRATGIPQMRNHN